jgi:hypothetical protein
VNLFPKYGMPRCSACRGDYEDPDSSVMEGEDAETETEDSTSE